MRWEPLKCVAKAHRGVGNLGTLGLQLASEVRAASRGCTLRAVESDTKSRGSVLSRRTVSENRCGQTARGESFRF